MAVFSDCSVVLDLKNAPYKEKKKLMTAVLDNGGNIAYVVNQKSSFVVATSLETISISKWRNAQRHKIPVVSVQYVWSCLEKGVLLPVQEHVFKPPSSDLTPKPAPFSGLKFRDQPQNSGIYHEKPELEVKDGAYLGRFRLYRENDHDIPEFPPDFQIAKYSILAKAQPKTWSVLELQSTKGQAGRQYRVVSSIIHEAEKSAVCDKQVHSCSSEDAVEAYLMLSNELQLQGFTQTQSLPPWAEKLTSHSLQQLLLEEKLNCSTVLQEVGVFLELIWTEALGSLSGILTVPVTSISLNDVSRVEGLLLQVQKTQNEDEVKDLLKEVNTLLPVSMKEPESVPKLVSQKLDLCQLIRDILNVTEVTLGNPFPSSLGKYRALRCSIEQVPFESPEFLSVSHLLQDRPAQIQKILRVSRGTELLMFRNELDNIKPLLHSTASSSLVGILSRGLLLPRVGVEQHGVERTDIGNLGSGIYFSDSLNTSIKYSKPSVNDGCRLLLVCDVALGQCKDLDKRDFTLTSAPEGYNSVHGVRRTEKTHSDFEDDEYVVYNTDQIRLKYVVQYFLPDDEVKDFQPHVNTTLAPPHFSSSSLLLPSDDGEGLGETKNPLEEVTAGLLDSNGQTLPLKAVHVRCKLLDLISQVVIFQTYTNTSSVPIEAKYVFPLEETAAVCGFEAFINGKHVIGKVKEKEQARKEYKQAIEKGHGAYLMDQDAPDVFTISVGNLPPGATVLIKVTFITELVVRAGTIVFALPGSVAPWEQSSALNQRTQTTVEKVCVNELQPEGEFSLCMSIEMPIEITKLECSHQIKIKRTDCMAVVSTLPDQTLSTDGFRLSVTLLQMHMPRMWVEKHPEKDTEACMLVFYPYFYSSGVSDVSDVIIVLDTSESMRGDAMVNARRVALKVLNSLDRSLRVNIISFGSDYKEAFPSSSVLEDVFEEAKKFIMTSAAVGGSTELWRPLRTLSLLPPSHKIRNVLLISDGHVQNQPETLQLVRDNVKHTRLFTCGLSLTANRYILRALAQAGGGTYEFFDTKTKHTWAEKVNSQVRCMVSPGCSSVTVKWQRFNSTAPPPVQAPSQLQALFSDCHTLVYGFVPHCTQATLFGKLRGKKKIENMVSTTELQKTKGTFLHKLTARAIIRDYEDGSLGFSEAEHEGKKAELKSYIIELSKEFSILSQFTSFVAIEERDEEQPDSGFTDITKIIAEEDVDVLSYMGWSSFEQEQWNRESDEEVAASSQGSQESDEEDEESSKSCQESVDDNEYYQGSQESDEEDEECSKEYDDVQFYDFLKLSEISVSSSLHMTEEQSEISEGCAFVRPLKSFGRRMPAFECGSSPDTVCPSTNDIIPDSSPADIDIEVPRHHCFQQKSKKAYEPKMCSLASMDVLPPRSNDSLASNTFMLSRAIPCSGYLRVPPTSIDRSGRDSEITASIDSLRTTLPSPSPGSTALAPAAHLDPPYVTPVFGFGSSGSSVPPCGFGASSYSARSSSSDFRATNAPAIVRYHCSQIGSSVSMDTSLPRFGMGLPSIISHVEQSAPPHATVDFGFPPPTSTVGMRGPAPPPPAPAFGFTPPASTVQYGDPASPPPAGAFGFLPSTSTVQQGAPAPRPPRVCFGSAPSVYSHPPAFLEDPAPAFDSDAFASMPLRLHQKSFSGFNIQQSATIPQSKIMRLSAKKICRIPREGFDQMLKDSISEQSSQPERINWEDLFNLQHQDGYWECTGTLSRFLGLDVDFFANVFLKEKGICSLGAKAQADILKLVATLLVLQLMRVMKMADGKLFQTLFRLADHPEPRPACWEAVKRAVEWVCWADRQYPCVCSRLELGLDWESCTRQLLKVDSLPPFSTLIPLLQRSTPVM
ncbi:protein mono-ADP-ribosyltransferase PARP4 isoform X2 [Silurus meridionalis]|uniref:protein mono-ADP-ribosyltransferase PARP4 isoform X2 n=1 Tax=Silurus meridionalis TaxID=175797 RepID=UPI001EEA6356|nr:protein mono-ADP-ribosyltransferase PARP4 isoform X2 [Silurus meridionalis]